MRKIILASASPRRRELLEKAEIPFNLCIKNVDETVPEGLTPEEAAMFVAEKKALAVAGVDEEAVVIGADTIVVLDGEILGKPADEEDAIKMLMRLSGREHTVITGVCLACGDKKTTFCKSSKVTFYKLERDEVKRYVRTGEPMDKAGAYGIQGKGSLFVESIEGDYFNIVGLPLASVVRELKKFEEEAK